MNKEAIIIRKARERYPLTYSIQGKVSQKEMEIIESRCDVNVIGVYMDGSCYYSFRYNPNTMTYKDAISICERHLNDESVNAKLLCKALNIISDEDLEKMLNKVTSYIQCNPIDDKPM